MLNQKKILKSEKSIILILISFFVFFLILALLVRFNLIELENPFLNFLDNLSTGRISLFLNSLLVFLNNPIIGVGISYNNQNIAGSHNFMFDSLYQSGFMGSVFFFTAILTFLHKSSKLNNNHFLGSKNIVFLILLSSLFEVSFMFYISDTIFWFYAGLILSSLKKNKSSYLSFYLT
jgi:hypothetical protein